MGSRHLKRSSLYVLSAAALLAGPDRAWAWGFGKAQASAVLGVPLDFSVGLRLDAAEALPECLSAEVSAGDIPLPRSAVFVALETAASGPVLRVRTTVAIDEPLVTVQLSAGCASRATRKFTLFADPPGHLAAPALASAEALPPAPPAIPAAATPAPMAAPVPQAPLATTTPAPGLPGESGPRAGAAGAAPDTQARAGKAAAAPRPRGTDPTEPPGDVSASAASGNPARAPRSRLQLDAPTLMTPATGTVFGAGVAAALQSAQDAASAARSAASAAQARSAEMQKSIDALRQEAQANREALARLTQALQDTQSGRPGWLWAALAALGGLSALLYVRMRRLQGGHNPPPWWSSGAAVPAAGPGFPPPPIGQVTQVLAPRAPMAPPDATDAAPDAASTPLTPPLTQAAGGAGAAGGRAPAPEPAARPQAAPAAAEPLQTPLVPAPAVAALPSVSIDELLDLQQQVEFFSVLGQEDAALKLLVEHLRYTRGDYPLPHLQLLEMYRQRSDEPAYEAARVGFRQRFGVTWPAWGQGPGAQRHLQDLPDMLRDIERVWPDPVQAMVHLEHLLRAADRIDSLDPTVQGELLFLFTMARDLRDHPAAAPAPLDMALPLGDDSLGARAARPAAAAALAATASVTRTPADRSTSPKLDAALKLAGAPSVMDLGLDLDLDMDLDQGQGQALDLDLDLTLDLESPGAARGPYDLPMVEGALDQTEAPAARGSAGAAGAAGAAAWPPKSSPVPLPSIDLPLPEGDGAGSRQDAVPPGRQSGPAQPDELDLMLDEVGVPSPSSSSPGLKPAEELLSLEFPELDIPISVPAPIASAAAAAVDLDLSLDELEADGPLPALSAGQEQAASRFGLFGEELKPGKKR